MTRFAYSPRWYKVKETDTRRPRRVLHSRAPEHQTPVGTRPGDEDAVAYKFINKVLTKTELDDLFKYRIQVTAR